MPFVDEGEATSFCLSLCRFPFHSNCVCDIRSAHLSSVPVLQRSFVSLRILTQERLVGSSTASCLAWSRYIRSKEIV